VNQQLDIATLHGLTWDACCPALLREDPRTLSSRYNNTVSSKLVGRPEEILDATNDDLRAPIFLHPDENTVWESRTLSG